MKRIFACVFLVLILCSCQNEKRTLPQYPLSTGAEVAVSYQNTDFKANIKQTENSLTLTLTEPQELGGLEIVSSAEGTEIHNSDLTLSYGVGQLESTCPLAELYAVLNALNTQKPELAESGEDLTADFDYGGYKCRVKVNPQSGKIREIKTEKCVFCFMS